MVELGREFHANLLFWKWAIDHELLLEGEALSAPCYTAIKRPAKKHYLSDAIVDAVGGFCVERKLFWKYDLPKERTAELKRNAHCQQTCTITTNLLRAARYGRDSVDHARTSRRQAGCRKRPDTDER